EPIASIVICLLILKAAYDIFRAAIDQMVDKSCSMEQEGEIRACVEGQKGVAGIDMLQTRMFGNRIYVDVEIAVDKHLTIEEGHDIAERVHDALEQQFSTVKHVMVHVNPTKE
ncbi:MAG: cation-efflux pump, partial [Lachnospiraceae bacterium]|nr:cation-efflux pump [Lachnospiraceae bacterium]